jgi:hypothetical protein
MKAFLLSLLVIVWLALPHAGELQAMVKNEVCKTTTCNQANTCKQTQIRKIENNKVKKSVPKKEKPVSALLFDSMMYPVMAF